LANLLHDRVSSGLGQPAAIGKPDFVSIEIDVGPDRALLSHKRWASSRHWGHLFL